MRISIITVVFNNVATIADAINSVVSQTYPDIEYIVIDGSSTDGTVELINEFKDRISIFISEPDKGIYDAMNKGIKLASGDIIGILNSDDVYYDNSVLNKVVNTFENPLIDACYSDLFYVDRTDLNKVIRYWKSCDYKEELLKEGWISPHPTFFARRNLYEKYGDFDLNYKLAADFELMIRFMCRYKIRTKYIPEVFVKMRIGGDTNKSMSNILKQNIEIYNALLKHNINVNAFYFFMNKFIARFLQFVAKPPIDA